jgi:hypothetical protein
MHLFHTYSNWTKDTVVKTYEDGDTMPFKTVATYSGTCTKCGMLKFKKVKY